ncbi:hypothetical protein PV08_02221 [Exophiala spinifera]|uniref:N-acetyltransferase domain-containing protein n=1 Tax=Exophiala spinifera TaxID=91928 RepID=A0A0D1Z1V6_9EURO|nr:uncharacterized protein PV08_02221 [Exophiala spinifera]KIW21641.1 hypothetical protein PV08_02221 [Exophiala spinifera]
MAAPSPSSVNELRRILRLLSTAVETLIDDRDRVNREEIDGHGTPHITGLQSRTQYDAVKVIRSAVGSLESLIVDPYNVLLDFSMSYLQSRALHIAAENDIAAKLAESGPEGLCSSELARITGIQDEKLRRIMRVLVSNHIFAEVKDDHFVNNHISQVLANDIEFRALIVTRGQIQYAASDFLPNALSKASKHAADRPSPNAFQLAARTKLPFFEWLHQMLPERDVDWRFPNPEQYQQYYVGSEHVSSNDVVIARPEKALFNVAMGGLGQTHDQCCIEGYPWLDLADKATIVDVGGGIGMFCMRLHSVHPKFNIVVQDKAPVIEHAVSVWKDKCPDAIALGTAKLMAHDFFQRNPVYGRYILATTHPAAAILSNIRESMTSSSSLLIAEILMVSTLGSDKVRAAPQPLLANYGRAMNTALAMDLNMMTMTEGKERSPEDFDQIVRASGLRIASKVTVLGDGQVEIATPRLLLRAARENDVDSLHEAFSNPEVMRYWSTTPHPSKTETVEWLSKMISSPQNGVTDFVIALPTSHAIGKIGVWQDSEIGFLLSRQSWGKGFAREAMLGILEYLFVDRGLVEITADIDPRNRRSVSVLESMGFVKTGFKEKTWEVGGEWVDSVYYGLARTAWEQNKTVSGR